MTPRTEMEMGCKVFSCCMFNVYYYSGCLYIKETLTHFTVSHEMKKKKKPGKLFDRKDSEPPQY